MESRRALGELITLESTLGFQLDGIVYRQDSARTTVVHIHGSFGNFYQSRFVRLMAAMYRDAGMNLLSVNLASHDGLVEGYRHEDEFEYAGGAVADFNECTADISGAVQFAQSFSDRIILQGHSLGCDRILEYLIVNGAPYDLVLLSPCDSYQLQANWIAPETVEEQIRRLKVKTSRHPDLDWLPIQEYGVKGGGDWTYNIPVTRKAFLTIAEGAPYRLMRISSPASFRLNKRAFVYIGGLDALQVWPHDVMFDYLGQRLDSVEAVFIGDGDHNLSGCEEAVTQRIIEWASQP